MAMQGYITKRFSDRDKKIIQIANAIIEEYQGQGLQLTLRQLYYQFVARDILPNHQKMYKLLGNVINDARLAGHVDWKAIVDHTRNLRGKQFWTSPGELVEAAAESYNVDRWDGQTERPEVWIEKDALLGVFERPCRRWDISYFSCRGYTSQSEMWVASQRMLSRYRETGQKTVVYHFGDHDPSGIDMTRDIEDRLVLFGEEEDYFRLERIALNAAQVKKYKCPPNPAKMTDARAQKYVAEYGKQSWELDALDPRVLAGLVQVWTEELIDNKELWKQREAEQADGRVKILKAAKRM